MSTSHRNGGQRIHCQRHDLMLRGATVRDAARLRLQKMPHTTAWMAVTPNEGLGQKMDGREYRYLAKWWLGRPLFEGTNATCPCCEETMDPYGDHLVSCKFNQPVARHNALRDALADTLKDVGIACQKEVAIGGARRPADLALPNLDQRGPTAIDLVVHHPLCPSAARGGMSVGPSRAPRSTRGRRAKSYAMDTAGCLLPWGGIPGEEWDHMQRRC